MTYNKWDIFYLGYFSLENENIIFNFKNNKNKNILEYNPCSTHAYCLNKISMLKILNNYNDYINNIHYDRFLSNKIFKNYIIVPMIFEQYYCSPIDNSIENIYDLINRKTQCVIGDYLHLHSLLSFIVYFWNKYKLNILVLLLFIILILLYFTNKYKKN